MSGLLLLVMLLDLAMALKAAEWTDGLGVLGPVVVGGFLLGMAMSYSRWNGLFPMVHSLVTGTVWVLLWVSRAPQIPAELLGPDRIAYIGQSFWSWLVLLFSDEPARSNLVFILELAFLLWWLGYLASWAVFREGRVWRAIIPLGLVMLVNVYFGPSSMGFYLAIFVLCALLLAVRSNLSEQEIDWRTRRVRYATDIQFDFLRDGLIFAIVVVMLAMLTPNAAGSGTLSDVLEPVRQPWQRVQAEWGRLFSSLNYQGTASRPAFGDTLTLGGPRHLGDTVIMDVRSAAGRYWRAVAYDTFTGSRWLSTNTLSEYVDFGNHVDVPEFQARREVTQTITTFYPAGNVLFAAPQPLRVSLKAEASLGVVEQPPGADAPVAEITMLHRRGAELRAGESYLVVSALSDATIEDLQEAGTDYPAWVTERYLDTPPDLTSRVAELAQQVTANAETPYDQAVALEQYLRGFTYNDQIEAPPPGVDAVDYFLFDVQQGYCDYYASAFAMMARTLGIPARVSAGYSQGEYIPEISAYRVREFNGHSWPEVFFPNYGWVEFEPTASELEIVRPHRPDEQAGAELLPTPPPEDQVPEEELFGEDPELGDGETPPADLAQTATGPGWIVGIGGMLLLVLVAAFVLLRPSSARNRRALLDPQMAAKLYGRLVQWASRLRLPLMPSQTPHEHAAVMYGAVPEGRNAITSITDLYVREQYSPYDPEERETEDAWQSWQVLQPTLRRHWLKVRFSPLTSLGNRFRRPKPAPSENGDELG
jgi:transglutaminase-like putative cysteine protease